MAKGGGSFAKTCFDGSVGVWSARMEKKTRFLIAFLAFFSTDLIAHNPEVVGSSPASATRKENDHPTGWSFFFSRLAKQALIYHPGYASDERSSLPSHISLSILKCWAFVK